MSRLTSPLRRTAKAVTRTLARIIIPALGADRTEEITSRSTLVVAPHPDDETLGCGATIARMRARGTPVFALLMTGGGQSPRPADMTVTELVAWRRAEATKALARLGVDEDSTIMLDFADGSLPSEPDALREAIRDVVSTTQVSQVMVTSRQDRHPDHAAVAQAAREVLTRYFPEVRLYEYAVWQRLPALTLTLNFVRAVLSPRSSPTSSVAARPHVVSTHGFLGVKHEAMAAYESQMPHFPLDFLRDFFLAFETFSVGTDPNSRGGVGSSTAQAGHTGSSATPRTDR